MLHNLDTEIMALFFELTLTCHVLNTFIKTSICLVNEHVEEKDLAREKAKRVKKYEEQSKLYAMMRDDLANDLAAIEKQKTDAYDKIKTSTDNINEIANRLIKEAH